VKVAQQSFPQAHTPPREEERENENEISKETAGKRLQWLH
jgi:hypothetical protein